MAPNDITSAILNAALQVHRRYGPGLLETVYEVALHTELTARGIQAERQKPIYLHTGQKAYLADLLVENTVICELKAVDAILGIHKQQLLTYLRLAEKPLGLLINFNVPLLKQGIHRIVNNLKE